MLARAHYNVVVVALAAKLARIAWATLRKGVSFERRSERALARCAKRDRPAPEPDRSARVHEVCGRILKMA